MSAPSCICTTGRFPGILKALLVSAAGLMAGACAQMGSMPQLAASEPASIKAAAAASDGRGELQKATEYWGQVYAKSPRDAQAALNYARNLKAMGEKRQALAVMQQASAIHVTDHAIMGEYGRLALELDQITIAEKALERADNKSNPDWKVISARGTALAKQGKYRDSIPMYERALALAPDQPSIMNNLALAHAMNGNPDKAEDLLKRAVSRGEHAERVNQNLAIVLGLQGKYDEAKLASARGLPPDQAAGNVDYLRKIVKLEPKPLAADSAKFAANTPSDKFAANAAAKKPGLKGSAGDSVTADSTASGWSTQVAAAKKAP
jgi:Flp pilus assembly protein TadD